MENTQGSGENPIVRDDPEIWSWSSHRGRGRTVAYIDLMDDDEPIERPLEEIPAASLISRRGEPCRNSSSSTPARGYFHVKPPAGSSARITLQSFVRPDIAAEIIDISSDDEPRVRHQAEAPLGQATGVIPPVRELPAVSSARPHHSKSTTKACRSPVFQLSMSPSNSPSARVSARTTENTELATLRQEKVPGLSLPVEPLSNEATPLVAVRPQLEHLGQSPRGLRRASESCDPLRMTEDLVSQAVSDAQRKTSHAPIGARADPEREQTTARRVETGATPTPLRADTTGNGQDTTSPAFRSKIGRSDRPRAIKSATRFISPRPSRDRPRHRPNGNQASPNPVPESSKITNDNLISAATDTSKQRLEDLDPRSSERLDLHIGNLILEHPRDTSQTRSKSTIIGPEGIAMGAQVSAHTTATSLVSNSAETEVTPRIEESNLKKPALSPSAIPRTDAGTVPHVSLDFIEHGEDQILANALMFNAVTEVEAARRGLELMLKRRLEDRYEDHAYLVKNTMWRQRTCYERSVSAHLDCPKAQTASLSRPRFIQSTSPFANMRIIQMTGDKSSKESLKEFTQETFTKAAPKDIVTKTTWNVSATTYEPKALEIPSFMEYVSLRSNILADNESKLLTRPYFGDDEPEERQDVLNKDLPKKYDIKHDTNALSDLRDEQCRFYFGAVNSFLVDVGITWDVLLFWLLSADTVLQQINLRSDGYGEFESIIQDRSNYNKETFRRDKERVNEDKIAILFDDSKQWRILLQQLKEPTAAHLRLAAVASETILANCNFNPWYMAKQSDTMQQYVRSRTQAANTIPNSTFRSIVCRICHEHNCLHHGQVCEDPDSGSLAESSDTSSEDEDDGNDDTQIVSQRTSLSQISDSQSDDEDCIPAHLEPLDDNIEKVINYKRLVNRELPNNDKRYNVPKCAIPPPGPFKPRWWESNTGTMKWEKRNPFIPCNHSGSCVEANCRCFRERVTCEKTCSCSLACNRRFPGCKCASVPGKRICGSAAACLCFKFNRECDADLCGICGAAEVLDPINRCNQEISDHRCTNVGIQKGIPKKTLLGKSEVHGLGLYAGQDIQQEDMIGEYTGEILSVGESERREVVYHYEQNMYLFKLNKQQDVDATHMGNKMRFINNANKNRSNCYCRVVFCNTVFRVALYANTNIEAGTELFFHYNYPEEMTKNFKQPKGTVVAVKQVTKQTNKVTSKRSSTHASSNSDVVPSNSGAPIERPWVREALAKARAAKAAKRKAMLAANGKNTANALKQPRKSAGGPCTFGSTRHATVRGRLKRGPGLERRNESTASRSAIESDDETSRRGRTRPALVVQDTDEEDEDEDVQSDDARGRRRTKADEGSGEEEHGDSEANASYSNTNPRRSGRSRSRPRKLNSAPVVAVKDLKKVKKKMGGVRPGAGRKRKRPVVLNSDDE